MESFKKGKQMTGAYKPAGAPFSGVIQWTKINWKRVIKAVKRLQMRIAKAVREGKHGKAKALQWILTHSYYAKLLAVRKVTSNKGKNTPGIDGITWTLCSQKANAVKQLNRKNYKPQPLRRIYIPKKNGRKRPLSIPTMKDRAMQALYKMALEPAAETKADPNSYGFRLFRRCADAIAQAFICLSKKRSPIWILEGDIKACFDEINHKWLIDNIPMDKKILSLWLKSGYVKQGKLYPSHKGTPQGGIISPVIANMTLDGLENVAKTSVPQRIFGNTRSKINVIRYADDFIVTCVSKEILQDKVKPAIESFLKKRGLELSQEKTRITRIDQGFDFLGQNCRKYKGKMLITPAKDNVRDFKENTNAVIRKCQALPAHELISILNPKLRGWANYHRHIVAGRVFGDVDNCMYKKLWNWMRKKHPKKRISWLVRKYWSKAYKLWIFSSKDRKDKPCQLIQTSRIGIRRHIKIKSEANPFDWNFADYFRKRKVGYASNGV